MSTKLDVNTLLTAAMKSKLDSTAAAAETSTVQEGKGDADFNIDLKSNTEVGSMDDFNINLEGVAFEQRAEEYLGESTIANMRAAIASGLAVNTVLEARINSRILP
jgi:hypothetical protein